MNPFIEVKKFIIPVPIIPLLLVLQHWILLNVMSESFKPLLPFRSLFHILAKVVLQLLLVKIDSFSFSNQGWMYPLVSHTSALH